MLLLNPFRFGAAADFHTKAIDLDGSTEYLYNSTEQDIGIANAFTYQIWYKSSYVSTTQYLMGLRSSGGAGNAILCDIVSSKFRAYIYDSGGNIVKNYTSSITLSNDTIYDFGVTWNGTNFKIYVNGTEDTSVTKTSDNSGTLTNTNRYVGIGINTVAGGSYAKGLICRTNLWNSALSATEMTALNNSGNGYKLDVRNANGNYTSTSALKHQWCLGKDSGLTTSDYVSSGTINVYANASNISAADIVTF